MARDKHILNVHVPVPLFKEVVSLNETTGISYTEFAVRAIAAAIANYKKTGSVPPAPVLEG